MRIWSTKPRTIKKYVQKFGTVYKPKRDTELEFLMGPAWEDRWAGTTGSGQKKSCGPLWPALLSELRYWWRIAGANSNLQIQLRAPDELNLQQATPGCKLLGVRLEAIREDPSHLRPEPGLTPLSSLGLLGAGVGAQTHACPHSWPLTLTVCIIL